MVGWSPGDDVCIYSYNLGVGVHVHEDEVDASSRRMDMNWVEALNRMG
jgi:hypothetical protein